MTYNDRKPKPTLQEGHISGEQYSCHFSAGHEAGHQHVRGQRAHPQQKSVDPALQHHGRKKGVHAELEQLPRQVHVPEQESRRAQQEKERSRRAERKRTHPENVCSIHPSLYPLSSFLLLLLLLLYASSTTISPIFRARFDLRTVCIMATG